MFRKGLGIPDREMSAAAHKDHFSFHINLLNKVLGKSNATLTINSPYDGFAEEQSVAFEATHTGELSIVGFPGFPDRIEEVKREGINKVGITETQNDMALTFRRESIPVIGGDGKSAFVINRS